MLILVTGATGLLGARLCAHLKSQGHAVVQAGHTRSADIRMDLTQRAAVRAELDRCRPQCIINLVALTNVDECERDPHKAYLLNACVVENLAAWVSRGGQAHLVQVSTDQVYDGAGPHGEDDFRLTNVYALTKYAGEIAARSAGATVLRTNFFGRSVLAGRASFTDWLLDALRSRRPIKVFTDVKFSPLSMQSVCDHLDLAVRKRKGGTFNLGARTGISKADFAFALAKLFDLDPSSLTRGTSDEVTLAAYRPKDMTMDVRAYEAAFGVQLPTVENQIESMKGDYNAAA